MRSPTSTINRCQTVDDYYWCLVFFAIITYIQALLRNGIGLSNRDLWPPTYSVHSISLWQVRIRQPYMNASRTYFKSRSVLIVFENNVTSSSVYVWFVAHLYINNICRMNHHSISCINTMQGVQTKNMPQLNREYGWRARWWVNVICWVWVARQCIE